MRLISKKVTYLSLCTALSLIIVVLMITLLVKATNREVSQDEYVVLYGKYIW
jgi:hypothetical protein